MNPVAEVKTKPKATPESGRANGGKTRDANSTKSISVPTDKGTNVTFGATAGMPAWKQLYKAAVLETKMDLVPRQVQEARKAAGERAMHLIREPADDDLELQDLVYASRVLDELNRKCQSARDSKPK
jgi:hypothetical protein